MTSTDKSKRMQRKINELGIDAHCVLCGEKSVTVLEKIKFNNLPQKANSFFEEHHIAGCHEGETLTICRNCHAQLTDEQLDYPERLLQKNREPEMKAISFFMGISGILFLIASFCAIHAKTLYDFILETSKKEGKNNEKQL